MFGISKKGFEQSPVEMTKISTTGQLSFDKSDDLYSPMKRREVESVDSFQFSSQQQPEEFKDTWGCVVVCERQTVFQSWKIINRDSSFEWVDGLMKNVKKVVSYGGWLAVKGLPLSWWSSKFFKQIGDICGGLIEVDKRTKNFKSLYEARIKVRENESGFLPEWVKLTEGEQSYIVHIQPLSPAIQSLNIIKREQQFQSFCEKRISGAAEWSSGGIADGRNLSRSCVECSPENSKLVGADSLTSDVAIGNLKILEKNRFSAGVNLKRLEAATFSSKIGKSSEMVTPCTMPEELKIDKEQVEGMGIENNLLNSVLDVPEEGDGQVESLRMEKKLFNGRPADSYKGGTRSLMERNNCLVGEKSTSRASGFRVNKVFSGPWPRVSMAQSENVEVGSKPTFGSAKSKLPRRHSADDLLERESRPNSYGATISVENKSVLRKEDKNVTDEFEPTNLLTELKESLTKMSKDGGSLDEAMEVEARDLGVHRGNDSFEAELEKEEGDWNSTLADLVDTHDEDEAELLSFGLPENESLNSVDESDNWDEEFSSLEGEADNDPLEDINFRLENFLEDPPISNSLVIHRIERPMEKPIGLFQLEKEKRWDTLKFKDYTSSESQKEHSISWQIGEVPCSYEDGIDSPECV
ncbi:hypothetical protein M0R45_030524 [Rubus argutus]|uniref:DUF4283 domain-containing protein n=1 Tax=Rubus argutus TaxID=59490 RepID=A0AAW1WDU4_RUBAR